MRRAGPALAVMAALAASVACAGCAKKRGPAPDVTKVVYTVRGRIVDLPTPGKPASEFRVAHEAIPDFRASLPDGPLGMRAMVMPFTPGPGVSLDGLAVGEKIELRFEVDYAKAGGALRDSRVIGLRKLPAETALDVPG